MQTAIEATRDVTYQSSTPTRSHQEMSERHRTTLVRILGMLGSCHDNEALVAARKAEAMRKRLGLTWDDAIVATGEA